MKRVGNLYDGIVAFDNLLEAARKTLRGQKRKPAAARFFFDLEPELLRLQDELTGGDWQPQPYRVFVSTSRSHARSALPNCGIAWCTMRSAMFSIRSSSGG